MRVIINNTDITDMIKFQGVSWSSNSVDAPNAGRSLDGIMHRKLLGFKNKYEIQCVPLTSTQKASLTNLLAHEWLTVQIETNTGTSTHTMYPGATVKAGYLIKRDSGLELWEGFAFSLIER